MNVILDTHAFIWWVMDDSRISSVVRDLLTNEATVAYLSGASGWEISTKVQIGKLILPSVPGVFVPQHCAVNGVQSLPVTVEHGLNVFGLPLIHRDPFDRILVSQAQIEGMPIITADSMIAQYDVRVIW